MFDPVTFIGPLLVQLVVDVVRQIAFALPIAYAWEFEKNALWCRDGESAVLMELPLFITGLAAGSISVLTWPHEGIVPYPFAALAVVGSVPLTAAFLSRTGVMFREIGTQPPSMFATRESMIFALGIALMRFWSITLSAQ